MISPSSVGRKATVGGNFAITSSVGSVKSFSILSSALRFSSPRIERTCWYVRSWFANSKAGTRREEPPVAIARLNSFSFEYSCRVVATSRRQVSYAPSYSGNSLEGCVLTCSRAFANHGDTIRITAEASNVLLHPLEGCPLVDERIVGFIPFLPQLLGS
jgi:hypothetical protein